MRRRLTAVVLALTLAVSLCSCGKEETQPVTSTVEETTTESSVEKEVEVIALEEEAEQEDVLKEAVQQETEVSADVSDNESVASENERPIIIGKVEGNEYTNGFFGIGCTLDENWTMIPSETLAQATNYSEEIMDETLNDVSANDVEMHAALDMMASSGLMDSLMVMVMDIQGSEGEVLVFPEDDAEYSEINEELSDYLGSLEEEFRAIGLDDIKTEYSSGEFAGHKAMCMEFSGSYHMEEEGFSMNLEFFEKVAIIKVDSCIMTIITLSSMDDRCDEYLGMFYSVANQA